jgi:hypothetical protein
MAMAETWDEARLLAVVESDLPDEQFPDRCPYQFEDIMNPEFWPDLPFNGL